MPDGAQKLDSKSDPRRRCLKPADWPAADHAAWEVAITGGGLLEGGGPASGWRAATRKTVQDAYGRFLTFLALNGWLDQPLGPADRLTPERLRAFIAELEGQVAPITLRNRIINLAEALRVMAPEVEFPWLRRARSRLKGRARLLQQAPAARTGARPVPPRPRTDGPGRAGGHPARGLAGGALSRWLDDHAARLPPNPPKEPRRDADRQPSVEARRCLGDRARRRPDQEPLPLRPAAPRGADSLHRTISRACRPTLLGNRDDDHLWISWRNRPLSDADAYGRIIARTKAAFGIGVPPHRFRDSAITSMGEKAPELIWLAPALLHHADLRIAEKHYDLARDAQAVTTWQRHFAARRRTARARTRGRRKD